METGGLSGPSKFIVGVSTSRCPDEEYEYRRDTDALELLEISHPSMPHLPRPRDLAIKKLKRSSAGLKFLPAEVRTEATLVDTMEYLIAYIMDIDVDGVDPRFKESAAYVGDTPSPPFIMAFCCDRTRSIRKDFSLQGCLEPSGPLSSECIRVYEMCARMHIMNDHMLCEVPEEEGHNEVLNRQECNNCLKALNAMYDKARRIGDSALRSPNEAEFRAYYIILDMETHDRANRNGWIQDFMKRCPIVARDARVQLALQISRAFGSFDFEAYFRLAQAPSTPYLVSCLMHGFFRAARRSAMRVLRRGIKGKINVSEFSRRLCFEDEDEAHSWLESYRIPVDSSGCFIFDTKKKLAVPEKKFPRRVSTFIELKRAALVADGDAKFHTWEDESIRQKVRLALRASVVRIAPADTATQAAQSASTASAIAEQRREREKEILRQKIEAKKTEIKRQQELARERARLKEEEAKRKAAEEERRRAAHAMEELRRKEEEEKKRALEREMAVKAAREEQISPSCRRRSEREGERRNAT